MRGQTHEHTSPGVRQSRWRRPRMLDRPPSSFQQQTVLRVHEHGLARRNAEERRIESRYVINKAGSAGRHLPKRLWIGVEELLDIPPVLRDLRNRIPPVQQYVPELVRIGGTREAHGIAD